MSGMYEDDLDNSEDVVYTGQGGNNLLGDKRQFQDQVMLRGNLALKVHIFLLFSLLYYFFFNPSSHLVFEDPNMLNLSLYTEIYFLDLFIYLT